MDTSISAKVAELVAKGGSEKDLRAALAEMQAEVERLKAASVNGGVITAKVGKRGGVSVYGLQRQPVTLYASQWERLLGYGEKLAAFIKSNPSTEYDVAKLTSDDDKTFVAEVRQGKHAHAAIVGDGATSKLVCRLAAKSA